MSTNEPQHGESVKSESDTQLDEPPFYRVLLLNDDYTTMEFVVEVLKHVFRKSDEEATQIMLNVHNTGVGMCGLYPFEIAETKVDMVHSIAQEKGFPLKCTLERE